MKPLPIDFTTRTPRTSDIVLVGWRADGSSFSRTRIFGSLDLPRVIEVGQKWRREGLQVRAFYLGNKPLDLSDPEELR